MNPVHPLTTYFFELNSDIIFSSMPMPSGFSTKPFYEFLISPMRATSTQSVNLIILDLTTLIISGDEYNKQNFKELEEESCEHYKLTAVSVSMSGPENHAQNRAKRRRVGTAKNKAPTRVCT
jgi:hypothetical protein